MPAIFPCAGTASNILVGVTVMLVVVVVLVVLGFGYWHCNRRNSDTQHIMPYSVHSSRNKLDDDPHIEKSNNENEDRLWRYNNSLKVRKFMHGGGIGIGIAPPEEDSMPTMGISMSSDPNKLACLGITPPIARIHHLTSTEMELIDSDTSSVEHSLPAAIRKVQNADVERNITPHDTNCKSIQKEMNLKSLPLSTNIHDNGYRSSEIVV